MKIAESWLRANVFANRWSSAKMWWFRTMTDEGGGAIKSVPMQHACRGKLTWLIDCSRIRINFLINLARDFHSCTNQLLSGAWQLISSFGPLQLSQIDYSAVEALNKFELIKSNALSLGFGVGCGRYVICLCETVRRVYRLRFTALFTATFRVAWHRKLASLSWHTVSWSSNCSLNAN